MQEDFKFIDRTADIPAAADFCLLISDDCMLPYIRPGDRVCVSCREELSDMDVGLFLYRGRVLCRQVCEDYSGALLLLCANPAREAENLSVASSERDDCLCLGKVLLPRPLPPPVYD